MCERIVLVLVVVIAGCSEAHPVSTDAGPALDAPACDPAAAGAAHAERVGCAEVPACPLACEAACEGTLANATTCLEVTASCATPQCGGAS